MAYTDTWSSLESIPGSTAANLIDDKFRARFLGLRERLEDVLVEDVTDDPWVLKATVGGAVTGKVITIPHIAFHPLTGGSDVDVTLQYTLVLKDTGRMVAPIILPAGVQVTQVEVFIQGVSAGVNIKMYKVSATSPASTEVFTLDEAETLTIHAVGGVGGHTLSVGELAESTIAATHFWYITIDSTGVSSAVPAYTLYGARITYNTPDSSKTI